MIKNLKLKGKLSKITNRKVRVIVLYVFLLSLTFLPLMGYKRHLVDETKWQKRTKYGIEKIHLLPSPDGSTPALLVGGYIDLYSLNAYNGFVHWQITSLPPPYSDFKGYTFYDSALADIDNNGKLDFLVIHSIILNGTVEGLDTIGGLYIFDPYTGSLAKAFYFGNDTSHLGVGTFKPCIGKGIILVGDYYLPGFPSNETKYQFVLVLDGSTFQPIYNLTIRKSYVDLVSTYDLNSDGYDEIILSIVNGTVVVLDGQDFGILWNSTLPLSTGFEAGDCDFYDLTSDGITDLVLTDERYNIVALDGSNGTVLWRHSFGYGYLGTAIADIDNDGKVEVVTTCLEDLYIVDALTGAVEVHKRTPFYFYASNVNVVDIYSNGTLYIFASSFTFYGGEAYLFSSNFDYIRSLDVPYGWIHHCLFIDLNHDGVLELLGGCFNGSNAAFLYSFSGTFTYPFFLYFFFVLFAFAFLISLLLLYRTFLSYSRRSFY